MKHKVKVTVIDKKLYPELQQQYCADPDSGSCPCYNVGDEFVFYRMKEENTMIACCSDGTRPVIFKIERIDEK